MKRFIAGASIGIAGVVGTSAVMAQEADKAAKGDVNVRIDTVVVTAQHREQDAQDVGVALTVLSGKDIAERNISNVNQLQNATPSLEIEPAFGSGQPQFRLRGVGFQDYASNNTSTVGVYVDEVSYPFPIMTQGLLFDLDRVEVLRGPQGSLYGRNTTGGAINFLSNRPTKETRAGFTAGYSSNKEASTEGFISGSIAENLRGRFSFATQNGGGWQHNRVTGESLGDKDAYALRGQLELDASRDLKFLLTVHHARDKSEAQGLYLFKPFATNAKTTPVIAADTDTTATGWGLRPAYAKAVGIDPASKPQRDNTSDGISLKTTLDLNGAQLTSITSYQKLRRRELIDWDASSSPESDEYFDTGAKVFSQELRLASDGKGPLNWLAGVYYSNEKLDDKFYSDFNNSLGFATLTSYNQKAQSLSGFGQIDYQVNSRLKLIAGLRQEYEKRDLNNFRSGYLEGANFFPVTDVTTSATSTSGKVGLEYWLTSNALLYANISRGVKSGGFTAYNSANAGKIQPFKPEGLLAYEVGVKSDISRTLRVNGSLFYYDYHDQQVLSATWDPVRGAVGRIVNAPKAEIYGGEVELQWEPFERFKISQSIGYKTGTYKDFNALDLAASSAANQAIYTSYNGKSLNFPTLTYGGAISYEWAAGNYNFRAITDYSYRNNYNSWLSSAGTYDVAGYWLANARITAAQAGSPWSVSLWGRNIFNKKYDLTRNFFVNAQVAAAGEPATVGVQVNYAY